MDGPANQSCADPEKYCVSISPLILTTGLRPGEDAFSDLLLVCESATRFLTHFYIQLIGLTVMRVGAEL